MNNRDVQIINNCNKHYKEMLEELSTVPTYEQFIDPANKVMNKAIKIDIAQIGENLTHLSEESMKQIDQSDIRGIVDIRNIIVHGYAQIKERALYNTITDDMPRLMEQLNNIK